MADRSKFISNQTYNEAMSEWARLKEAERALFSACRNSLLRPDPMSPWWVRILGYGWRLVVLSLIGVLFAIGCIFLHLRHPSFSQKVSRSLANIVDLEQAKLDPFQWNKDEAKSRSFTGAGHARSLIRTIEAEIVRMKLPLSQLWQKQWTIEEIHAARVTANIRGGTITKFSTETEEEPAQNEEPSFKGEALPVSPKLDLEEEAKNEAEVSNENIPKIEPNDQPTDEALIDENILKKNAFGIAPDPHQLKIQKFSTDDLTLHWGASTNTKGSLIGTQFNIVRTKSDHWQLSALGGNLNLAWLRDVNLEGLTATYTGSRIEFAESKFSVETGQGLLSGYLTIEDAPQVHLQCRLINFPLDSLVEPIYRDQISLVVEGPVKLRGSTNLSSGITTEGSVKIVSGRIRQLPVFQTLAALTARLRLRQLEITNGQINFKTAQGRLMVDSFQAECGDDIRLTGHFSLEKKRFLGDAKIGLKSASLRRLPPAVVSQIFQAGEQEWLWLSVPLNGPVNTLTAETVETITRAQNAISRESTPQKK